MSTKKKQSRREALGFMGAAGLGALVGCSAPPTPPDGSGGKGGTKPTSGGSTPTTGGNPETGGTNTGGVSTGGVSTGGKPTGGSPTGGKATGGTPTGDGGTSSGGKATGGTPTGEGGSGGSGTGSTDSGGSSGKGGSSGGTASGGTSGGGGGTASGGSAGKGGSTGGTGTGPTCTTQKEVDLGPFPNRKKLERRDIRANSNGSKVREGAQLILRCNVYDKETCKPLPNVYVSVWHCEARGIYSSYDGTGINKSGSLEGDVKDDYLRGVQKTNEQGVAEFQTVHPGSYPLRAIHIHYGVHADLDKGVAAMAPPPSANGGGSAPQGSSISGVFVAQMYFEDEFNDKIFKKFPQFYTSRNSAGLPHHVNKQKAGDSRQGDGIFVAAGATVPMVRVTEDAASGGYIGEVDIMVTKSSVGL